MSNVVIPAQLRPKDGRFGSGPAKIRPEQLAALAESGAAYLGTSHRQPPVRSLVQRIRGGLAELFGLPADYTVALGNGGTSAFWEMATFGLIREHSQHLSFGEFSARFAALAGRAPWLSEPPVVESAPGTHPDPRPDPRADTYALTHNETSTGVAMPVRRVPGADPAQRSQVVGTIDITGGLAADDIAAALRANGIVDTESYRKLGRSQLRIGMFPAVDPADVEALTACIDYVAAHVAS